MSTSNQNPTFSELGVAQEIVSALAEQSIVEAFAIQALTLPIALEGRDLIGQARTGMGKTLGFGVPVLDRIFDDADIEELDGTPRALVVVPTRELCVQVGEDLEQAARHLPIRVTTIYGGTPYEDQEKACGREATLLSAPRVASSTCSTGESCAWTPYASSSWTKPTRCSTSGSCRRLRRSSPA